MSRFEQRFGSHTELHLYSGVSVPSRFDNKTWWYKGKQRTLKKLKEMYQEAERHGDYNEKHTIEKAIKTAVKHYETEEEQQRRNPKPVIIQQPPAPAVVTHHHHKETVVKEIQKPKSAARKYWEFIGVIAGGFGGAVAIAQGAIYFGFASAGALTPIMIGVGVVGGAVAILRTIAYFSSRELREAH